MSAETTSTTTPTIDHLIDQYDQWKEVLDLGNDDYDTIAKLVALYRFSISNYNEPGIELLLRAVEAVEAA